MSTCSSKASRYSTSSIRFFSTSLSKAVFACLLLSGLLTGFGAATPASASHFTKDILPRSPITRAARVLQFPPDINCGSLMLHRYDGTPNPEIRNGILHRAQGAVKIPPDTFVIYRPNQHYFADPGVLKNIRADGIDCVRFRFYSMSDGEEKQGDNGLAGLTRLTALKYLDLDRAEVTDRGLSKLAPMQKLEQLAAFATAITGPAFKDLKWPSLKSLKFSNTTFKASDIAALATSFPRLEMISLSRVGLDNDCVKELGRCVTVEDLDISDNPRINDAAIPYLVSLKKLRRLEVQSTGINCSSLARLAPLSKLQVILIRKNSAKTGMY